MSRKKHEDDAKPTIIDIDPADVIDEDVIKVEEEPDREETTKSAAWTPSVPRSLNWPIVGGALALGLLGGGFLYKDVLSNYFPSDTVTSLTSRIGAVEEKSKSIEATEQGLDRIAKQLTSDVDAIETNLATNKTDLTNLAARLEASLAEQASKIATLETSATELRTAIEIIKSAPVAAGSSGGTGGNVDPAVLASLGARIDALEKDLASLKAAKTGTEETTALTQSLSDLKAKLASGTSYAAELERIQRIVPAAEGFEDLQAFAVNGIPTPQGLATELRALVPSLPLPEKVAAADDSYLGSVTDFFSNLVTIKNVGEENWQQIAEKSAALADENKLVDAISLIDAAVGAKPAALTAWRDRANGRLGTEQALVTVSEAVTRHLLAKGQ